MNQLRHNRTILPDSPLTVAHFRSLNEGDGTRFKGLFLDHSDPDSAEPVPSQSGRRLSYKFQRLRERIRAAIAAGELAGKLPGERSLARQFNVNAKTLSKALTDLAAEGVLRRNIGLGTFVRGELTPAVVPKILLLTSTRDGLALGPVLVERGLDIHTHAPDGEMLPSLVAPYDLVVVASPDIDDQCLRDLIVRGKAVVTLDRLAQPFSTHAVLSHASLAATRAARDLITIGHRRLLLVPDDPGDADTSHAMGLAFPDADVRTADASEAADAARAGYTGFVCGRAISAHVLKAFRATGVEVPKAVSVIAYGRAVGEPDCCGHYVTDRLIANAIHTLLANGLPHKPLTLWIAGERIDRGTTAPPPAPPAAV